MAVHHPTPIGIVARWNKTSGGKEYRPAFLIEGEWMPTYPKTRPLFALDKLANADKSKPVYLVEGEKCAQSLIDIGITATTTQDIWPDHPEKVLGTTAEFAKKYPNTARAVTAAILEAGKWIDAGLQNKMKMAETIADKAYVNTSVDVINQRILGRYQNGLGKTWDDKNHMKFFADGNATFPFLSDGMWFLTQHKRWGLLKDHPDYLNVAKQINHIDIYKQAATASNTPVPKDVIRTSKFMDGVVWDGKDPKKYADSFKVKA
jgi:nitrate/nitrite transport system substrate-binding protein